MKTFNSLLSAVATMVALTGVIPCEATASDGVRAESLEVNKSITRRVYEEGLNQGRFEVPYSADFVGHGGRNTFTHADGMAEAKGWREAFPDLKITVDMQVAERDLVAVRIPPGFPLPPPDSGRFHASSVAPKLQLETTLAVAPQ